MCTRLFPPSACYAFCHTNSLPRPLYVRVNAYSLCECARWRADCYSCVKVILIGKPIHHSSLLTVHTAGFIKLHTQRSPPPPTDGTGQFVVYLAIVTPPPPPNQPAQMAQWLWHRLMGWQVLCSHLGTISHPDRGFKGPMGRCKATISSSLSLNNP